MLGMISMAHTIPSLALAGCGSEKSTSLKYDVDGSFAKISTGWVVSTGLKTMLLRADYHPSGDIGYTMPHPHDHP